MTQDPSHLAGPLIRCAFLMLDTHNEMSREHGLHPQQAHLLCIIGDRLPSIGEVGSFLRVEKSSMTGLVSRAEAAGLLERVKDESDTRTTRLKLTKEGLIVVERFKSAVTERIAGMVEILPPDERARLAGNLIAIVEAHHARPSAIAA